ncbi:hypothetical protein [Paenibacillus sp. MBLB4367]|uniref:hypothetical protein n=1 Tax=Paenibacillus sp. MBLB4367 TaxID=3384767 RepID=UPI00390838DD
MNRTNGPETERLLAELLQRLRAAGHEDAELLGMVGDAIGHAGELAAENERLKQEVKRLRGQLQMKAAGSMSSRLKDALRE